MNSFRVLVSAPYFLPILHRYQPWLESVGITAVAPPVRERLEEKELIEIMGDIDGVLCGDDRFTERVLTLAAPRLKVISKWGTGIDSIDSDAARRLGIQVRNTPGAFTDPVADTVLGYILAFARRIPWSTESMRSGVWEKLPSLSLREATLGIIGVGRIGGAVARRARAFGMTLLGNDVKTIDSSVVADTGLESVPLERLLAQSDFVSINCDLNPTSLHLIGQSELARMKPTAVLINTARGPVVDESALVAALEDGRLAGAALDVFEDEPLPADSPLRRMSQVLMAAHNSNSSPASWERVHENTLNNLLDGLGIPARAPTDFAASRV